jgi:hypothetical protein|tara:strand:+ start:2089 stop:2478 length:390 start_codon:yes stop_codon:yes gene_type:complete
MSSQILDYDHKDFKAILAIDFDHTICMSEYPDVGVQRKDSGQFIRKLAEEGYGIVINTCREGLALATAIKWLNKNKIPYHYVNCNFPHLIELFNADCRKISASVYIDDKCLTGLPAWKDIYKLINEKFK